MYMKLVFKVSLIFLSALMVVNTIEAKKYPFKIDSLREVYVSRSSSPGTKMLTVVAYGRTTDSAIEQAMLDAVVALAFDGAVGKNEMENCPAVLLNGRETYKDNQVFFDNFFKNGDFLKYVDKVNTSFPSGANNVKTKKGRRVQILLIVNWNGLADYFRKAGYKTAISELSNY